MGSHYLVVSRITASQSFVATSSRRFSKAVRGALMSGLSSFARAYIRLIIARETLDKAAITVNKTVSPSTPKRSPSASTFVSLERRSRLSA